MTTVSYMTIREAADTLNMIVPALEKLHDMFASPKMERPSRGRPYRVLHVLKYKHELRTDRNRIMSSELWESNFAMHDDGRLWPIVRRREAILYGKKRYFEGTKCDAGHRAEHYLKSDKCVECCRVAREAKAIAEHSRQPNSATHPGCNLP
jgi:hypothetical protein